MTTVTVSMPESLKEFLDHEVEAKGYGNVSEYIRGLLREAQSKDANARLEALLLEGLSRGGEDLALGPDFWRELKSDASVLLAKHKRSKGTKRKK